MTDEKRGSLVQRVDYIRDACRGKSVLHLGCTDWLLEKGGFRVDRFLFYDIGREHWPHLKFYLNWVNDLCVALFPQLADGIIVECALREGESLGEGSDQGGHCDSGS